MAVPRMKTHEPKGRRRIAAPKTPPLTDPGWRAFVLEWEQLTDAVDGDWRALRQGARRVKAKFVKTVPADAIEQHLAYAVFDLAVNWRVNPRIVRTAFSRVWSGSFDPYLRISASAHFWAWAGAVSQVDMGTAERAVSEARELIRDFPDPLKRINLERMMRRLTEASS